MFMTPKEWHEAIHCGQTLSDVYSKTNKQAIKFVDIIASYLFFCFFFYNAEMARDIPVLLVS